MTSVNIDDQRARLLLGILLAPQYVQFANRARALDVVTQEEPSLPM